MNMKRIFTGKLEEGAASILIQLTNTNLYVEHGEDKSLILHVSNVKNGTWDKLWEILDGCGTIEYKRID
jgi:hypothetical protein